MNFGGVFGVAGASSANGAGAWCQRGLGALAHRGARGDAEKASHPPYYAVHTNGSLVGAPEVGGNLGIASAGAPLLRGRYRQVEVAMVLDGAFTNAELLGRELEERGTLFHTRSDGELLLHLLAASDQKTFVNRVVDALHRIEGAYALLLLTPDHLVAVRDPWGFRPLLLGQGQGVFGLASESSALRSQGLEDVRDVELGEMLIFDGHGMESLRPFPRRPRRACAMEPLRAARPDSIQFGREIHAVRSRIGSLLGRDAPARADVVVSAPDVGMAAAAGFARQCDIPLEAGILQTAPGWTAVRSVVQGRRVVLVDDMVVQGQRAAALVKLLREAGALEVHVRIASPLLTGTCYYGVGLPEREDLAAVRNDLLRLRQLLDCDSLTFLTVDAMREAIGEDGHRYCDACLTGSYPLLPPARAPSGQLWLFGR